MEASELQRRKRTRWEENPWDSRRRWWWRSLRAGWAEVGGGCGELCSEAGASEEEVADGGGSGVLKEELDAAAGEAGRKRTGRERRRGERSCLWRLRGGPPFWPEGGGKRQMEERQEEVQTGCREEQKRWADKNFTFCNRMLRLALCAVTEWANSVSVSTEAPPTCWWVGQRGYTDTQCEIHRDEFELWITQSCITRSVVLNLSVRHRTGLVEMAKLPVLLLPNITEATCCFSMLLHVLHSVMCSPAAHVLIHRWK